MQSIALYVNKCFSSATSTDVSCLPTDGDAEYDHVVLVGSVQSACE